MNEKSYKLWSDSLAKENRRLRKMLGVSWVYIVVSHISLIIYFIIR